MVNICVFVNKKQEIYLFNLNSKLPNPLNNETNTDVCLIVKDLDKKSRDYEKTTIKYEEILNDKNLKKFIKQVLRLYFLVVIEFVIYLSIN